MYCGLENDLARKKQMHQICDNHKNTLAIFLWKRTELDIRLPAIGGFIMVIWWVARGGESGKLCPSDVESMNLKWKTATHLYSQSAVTSQQSLVNSQ